MKPRLLDLFCGAGGAAMGYHRAGFDVVGVDIRPQPNYPFEFIQTDALLIRESIWDMDCRFPPHAIHASPPCQTHSSLKARWRDHDHPDLVAATRALLEATSLPYVIENVVGAPLMNPIQLCGSSFGLGVRRHRLFEISFPMMSVPCAHYLERPRFRVYEHGRWFMSSVARVYGHGGGEAKDEWAEAMGIDWMTKPELSQAIPPAYTELIGHQLMSHIRQEAHA